MLTYSLLVAGICVVLTFGNLQDDLIHHKKQNLKKANQFHKSDAHLVSKDNVLYRDRNGAKKKEMERTKTSNDKELKNIRDGKIDGVKNPMRRMIDDDDGSGVPKSKAGDNVFGPSLGDASWDEELEIPDSKERIWRGTEFKFQKPTGIAPKPSTASILKSGKDDDGRTELNVWGPTKFVPGLHKSKSGSRSDYLKFGEHDIDSSEQFRKGQEDSHPVTRGGNHENDRWQPPWDSNDAKAVWDPYTQTRNSDQPSWIPRGSQNTENSGKLPKEQSTFGKSPWGPERLLNSSRVSGVASGLLNFRTLEDAAGPPNFSSPRAPGAPPSFGSLKGAGGPPNFGTLRGPGGPSYFGTLGGLSGLPNFGSPRAPNGSPNFGPLRGAGGPQNFGTIRGPSGPPNFGSPKGPGGPPNFALPRGPGEPPNFGLSDWPGGSPNFKPPRGPAGPPNFETYRGPGGPPNFRFPTGLHRPSNFGLPRGPERLQNFDLQGVSGRPSNFGLLSGPAGPPNFGHLGDPDGPNYGPPMASGNFGGLPNLGAGQRTPWSQGGPPKLAGPSGSPNGYPGMGRGPNGSWGSGKGLGFSPGPSPDVHFSGKGNSYSTMLNLIKTWPSIPSQLWPGHQANLRQISDNKNTTPEVLTSPYEPSNADTPQTPNPLTNFTTEETREFHNSTTPELSRNHNESSLVEASQTPNLLMEFKTPETPELHNSLISSTIEVASESHSLPARIRETSQSPNINSSSSNLTTNDEENPNPESTPPTNVNDETSASTTKSVLPGFSNESKEQSQEILQIITTETTESTTTTEKGGKVKTRYPGGPQIIPDIADDEPDTHKYFTEFITELCYRLATMNTDDARKIYFQIEKVVTRDVLSSETFAVAGQNILDSFQTFVAALNMNPPDYVQKLFALSHHTLINRDIALSQDINSLLDFINTLYTDEEKRSLAILLEEYNIYPNITSSTNDLLTKTINTLLKSPFLRLKDAQDMTVLVESLNRVVSERATGNNKFNLPSYRRQETLSTTSSEAVKNVNRHKRIDIFEYKLGKSNKMKPGKTFRSNKIINFNVNGKYVDRNQIKNARRYKKNEKITDNTDGYINPSSITIGNARFANRNQIRESNKIDRSNVKIGTFNIDGKYVYSNIMKDHEKDANLKLKEKTTKELDTKEGNSESSTESELYSTETEEFEKESDAKLGSAGENFKVPHQNEPSKNVPVYRKMKLLQVTAQSSMIPTPESHGDRYRSAANKIKLRNDQENKYKPLNTGSLRNKKYLVREVLRKVVKGFRNSNLQSRKTKKLQNMASSYSDEEETIKFKVNQALSKKDRRFSDGKDTFPYDVNDDEHKNSNPNYNSDLTMEVENGKIKKQPLNQMSSYSWENEEDTLKMNLYEAFNKAAV